MDHIVIDVFPVTTAVHSTEQRVNLAPATIKARNAQAKRANVFARPKALLAITANVVTYLVFITEILRIKDLVFMIWLLIISLHLT